LEAAIWSFCTYLNKKREPGLMTEDEARAALNSPKYDEIPIPKKIKPVPHFRDDVFPLPEWYHWINHH
jgi:hypothetical protein